MQTWHVSFPASLFLQGDGKKRDPRQDISVTQAYNFFLCGQIGPWDININKKTASATGLVELTPKSALDAVDPSVSINEWSIFCCVLSLSFKLLFNFVRCYNSCLIYWFTYFFTSSFQNAFYLVPCFGGYGREDTTQLTTTELSSQELQPVTSVSTYKQTMLSGAVTSGLNQCSL